MNALQPRLVHASPRLLSAAEHVRELAGERGCAALLPDAFDRIAQSLRALDGGCARAAHALIPPGDDDSSSARYARAAAAWPLAGEGGGPSHERQAELLAALDDAGMALRAAAERCARTRDLLAATMDAAGNSLLLAAGSDDRTSRTRQRAL
jgi:hypothetical protein